MDTLAYQPDCKNIIIFDKSGKPIGYCVTEKEADALCEKHPEYQWDFCSKKYKNINLPLLTIND